MSTEVKAAPLGEAEVREATNRWSSQGYFRIRNFGDKIFINEIVGGEAHTVQLQTHYEERSVQQQQVPYHGGPVDDRGRPPRPWEIVVRRPAPFEQKTETVDIPHSEHIETCGTCNGRGQVTCTWCHGSGRTLCSFCGGTGFRSETVFDTRRDASGNMVTTPRIVQRGCTCFGGRVTCTSCMGRGLKRCTSCAGSGQVKTFDQVVVRFLGSTKSEVLDVTPVPDEWFRRLSGEVLVEEKAQQIDLVPTVSPEVDTCARELLERSHDVDERGARILLQHLRIERVPITEVQYTYAGVEHKLWISGYEKEVYAPEAPWHRGRLMGMIGAIVLAVAAIAGVTILVLTLMR